METTFSSEASSSAVVDTPATSLSDASAPPTHSATPPQEATETLSSEATSDYKFKSWEEAEKGYKEIQSFKDKQMNELKDSHAKELEKYAAFTGAPEDGYTFTPSEELTEAGFTFDESNELYAQAKEMASSMGLNQEAFSGLMNLYAQDMHNSTTAFANEMHEMASQQVERDLASMSHEEKARFVPLLNQAAQIEGVSDAGINDLVDACGVEGLRTLMAIISNRAPSMPLNVNTYNDTPQSLREALGKAKTLHDKEEVNRRYAAFYGGETLNTDFMR